ATSPKYAHVPMILGSNGERLSKRHGAVSVMQYRDDGYLPQALLNYLARLGWSHGDEEIFSREELVEWFDLSAISRSPAKFNPEKLFWINQQYLKKTDNQQLAELVMPYLEKHNCQVLTGPNLNTVIELLKERVNTLEELADAAIYFYRRLEPSDELKAQYFNAEALSLLTGLIDTFKQLEWTRESIHQAIKNTAKNHDVKLPKIAMPLRVMTTGEVHTPSIDVVLELLGRDETLTRITACLDKIPK
nr:glutamate--tRNA ligase [Nitrosomonas sp.]